ncbi:hypothetical protein [Acetivibrio cellulolyticus]|uniref:hypothetical protein n=1 Tax=Acetivibrio cellulolyticus TaxID=35830 RepID=UPI0001E2D0B6|nr:hypothetical protein [Acetivibrio cellulolyticus]
MLTVEQYILQMKKKDKIDEFNFQNHAENMTTVIKYVMDYFNNYLNPEAYDYENIKVEQTLLKISEEIGNSYPKSKDFILRYYKEYKSRIDRTLKKYISDLRYYELFYCEEDYENAVNSFCNSPKVKGTGVENYKDDLVLLVQEIKDNETEKPSFSSYIYLDDLLIGWVKSIYIEYKVNVVRFVEDYMWKYNERYIERKYDSKSETHYRINRYNHRYNNNPFSIDEVYQENCNRPFIEGKKGELEMLMMYNWIFDNVEDSDYWSEYVNLCVSTGRVKIVKNINALFPVKVKDIAYPPDVQCSKSFIETYNGFINNDPGTSYILRLSYNKDNDIIWKDEKELSNVIINLHEAFSKYRPPAVIEIFPPIVSNNYGEEDFFQKYNILEKAMKKYTDLKIVMINAPERHYSKPKYLMQTVEDILNIRKTVKERKYHMKLVIDIPSLFKKKCYGHELEEKLDKLSEIRNCILGIHLSNIHDVYSIFSEIRKEDDVYLNTYGYHKYSDFLGGISALFNDNICRYFVPESIVSREDLEELVDVLLRGGFSFCVEEQKYV